LNVFSTSGIDRWPCVYEDLQCSECWRPEEQQVRSHLGRERMTQALGKQADIHSLVETKTGRQCDLAVPLLDMCSHGDLQGGIMGVFLLIAPNWQQPRPINLYSYTP
jgi:hypothetical protein